MIEIKQVAVVGAGTMGSAITQHFAMKGLHVIMLDQSEQSLSRGIEHIRQSLGEARDRRLIDETEFNAIVARIQTTTDIKKLSDAGLVVEAVFEDLDVKRSLFKDLEQVVGSDCVLASNTSSFLVSDIAARLQHPERVVGVHYFYHAAKNKLVEIIPGEKTEPSIVSSLEDFYTFYDKTPILVKDAPGFAVNRFFVPWLNEAARLYEEGFGSIPFIDRIACETFAVGMGPFALMNATGVPIAQHAAQGLADNLGEFYAPAAVLCEQVASKQNWNLTDENRLSGGSDQADMVRSRLVGATLGIAAQMVSEGVVDATSADLGARVGLRWPKGPFELMNTLGVDEVKTMVGSVFDHWNLAMPKFPFASCDSVSLQWVEAKKYDRSGFIIFNLPDRMNPLGEDVMVQLDQSFRSLDQDPEIEKIFILGKGKAFIAGADIKFFLDSMAANQLDRIQTFTEFGQKILNAISVSEKTTYAYLDGLTLGGGLELALACDYRIGTHKTVMGFPETGIGIYPGLGGTQRASRLIGKPLAKFMIATGQFIKAKKGYAYGLLDAIIEPVFNWKELADFELTEAQTGRCDIKLEERDFDLFDGQLDDALWSQPIFKDYQKSLQSKAPIALKMAMNLIEQGYAMKLPNALDLELSGLRDIFSTDDAKAGLSSILTGQRARFTGQ